MRVEAMTEKREVSFAEECKRLLGLCDEIGTKGDDGIMIISVIVYMLTNYLGTPLIYLTAACFFDES